VAGGPIASDPAGDPLDSVRVGNRAAAELLDDERGGHRAILAWRVGQTRGTERYDDQVGRSTASRARRSNSAVEVFGDVL
jgi:hypothetical protein